MPRWTWGSTRTASGRRRPGRACWRARGCSRWRWCRCCPAATCTASSRPHRRRAPREPAVGLLEQLHGLQDRVPLGLVPDTAIHWSRSCAQAGEALLLPSLAERLVQLLPASLGPVFSTRLAPIQPPVQTHLLLVLLVLLRKPPLRPLPFLAHLQTGVPLLLIAYCITTRLLFSAGPLHLPCRLLPLPLPLLLLRHLPLRGQFRKEVRQEELILAFRHDSAVNSRSLAHYNVDNTVSDVWTDELTQTMV
jgi:hypothetical protein